MICSGHLTMRAGGLLSIETNQALFIELGGGGGLEILG